MLNLLILNNTEGKVQTHLFNKVPINIPMSNTVFPPQVTSPKEEVSTVEAQNEIQSLVQEREPEVDIDLEFLYTRDIEFRQETIYFIVVDRFYDGDPNNSGGPNPEL